MKRVPLLVLFIAVFGLVGCSTLRTVPAGDSQSLLATPTYQLKVRADNPDLERTVYAMALADLKPILPIGKEKGAAGTVAVAFSSRHATASAWGSVGVGRSWYSGAYPPPSGAISDRGIPKAGPRTYENGTLLMTIRDADGHKLWSAEYQLKGRWSLADSPEAAARICLKKVTAALRKTLKK
jgi:hypothetical protein